MPRVKTEAAQRHGVREASSRNNEHLAFGVPELPKGDGEK